MASGDVKTTIDVAMLHCSIKDFILDCRRRARAGNLAG